MSYNLKVTIDGASGFCFGVTYAIEMAEDILEHDEYLYCLGDIVHNDMEVERLRERGLRVIDHNQLKELHNEKVLIRAHGEAPSTYELALQNNLTLIDASCPVVLKLQNRIKTSHDDDEQVLIYGKHGHAEVVGLNGQTKGKAIVFQDIAELNKVTLPKKFTLYSQTTKSVDNFYKIKDELTQRGYEVKANDTICRQVSGRYENLERFVKNFDKVVFVAGKKSSNGKVLFDVCKSFNPNSIFVSNVDELEKAWFQPNETVGVCGATSTPMWLMEHVKKVLTSY